MACCAMCRAAATSAPMVRLHYPAGYRAVDLEYENSARALNILTRDLRAISGSGEVPGVEMIAFCSPDADNYIALNVAKGRADELQKLLASRSIVGDSAVRLVYKGVGWEELARMVEASDLAHRAEVVEILRAPDLEIVRGMSESYSSIIESRLKKIDHGNAFDHIRSHFYPVLRNMLLVTTSRGDTARVFYRIGYNEADLAYAHNGERLNSLLDSLSEHDDAAVTVSCMLEPSGNNRINYYVARSRYEKLRNLIISQTGLGEDKVVFSTRGDGWIEVRNYVALTDARWRREALEVIDGGNLTIDASMAEKASEGRIKLLKAIDGGKTYHTLSTRFFPTLRNTVLLRAVTLEQRPEPAAELKPTEPADEALESRYWALKTNLLYDVVLSPSIEVEYRFSDRWSVGLEYNMAWWKNTHDGRTYELAVLSPEFRYHFSSASARRGHYVGAFSGFTWYDLSSTTTGHHGEGYFAGVSYGYIMPLTRQMFLEAGIGVGYLSTRYKDYTPTDGHNVYRRTKNAGYFGPLKARLALVWRFDSTKRKSIR